MMHLLAIIVIFLVLNTATASIGIWQKRALDTVFYDCGTAVPRERTLQRVIRDKVQKSRHSIKPFYGRLYDPKLNYQVLDVPAIYNIQTPPTSSESYYTRAHIILDQSYNLVDVITRLKNGHFIKCKRVDPSIPESSSTEVSGFECGHEYFPLKTIQLNVNEAISRMYKGSTYPAPFKGNLYIPELRYWIYPVLVEEKPNQARVQDGPYYVVISSTGEFIDVIAELINKAFIRCTKKPKAPDETLNVDENLRVGYLCGRKFFDSDDLKKTALMVKKGKNEVYSSYPRRYIGSPFQQDCWIYPIAFNELDNEKDQRTLKYFLVMNINFNVITAAIRTQEGRMQPCNISLRAPEVIQSETDDFVCKNIFFRNQHLMATVDLACKHIGSPLRRYPAHYVGPDFDIPGSYLTWPLLQDKMFANNAGNYRVVMNAECRLAGIIARDRDRDKTFYKCRRMINGSMPGGDSSEPITEKLKTYKKYQHN